MKREKNKILAKPAVQRSRRTKTRDRETLEKLKKHRELAREIRLIAGEYVAIFKILSPVFLCVVSAFLLVYFGPEALAGVKILWFPQLWRWRMP